MSKSELAAFGKSGRLEETVHFGPAPGMKLTYVLASDSRRPLLDVEAHPGQVIVLLPAAVAHDWCHSEIVGVSGKVDLGIKGTLSVLVEKDFACLDRSEEENADTFPNPLQGATC